MMSLFGRWTFALPTVTLSLIASVILCEPASAQPVAKTVPWVATNPLIPHDTWSGRQVTLKGTCMGADQFIWDPGDGSEPLASAVSDPYVVEASHAYTGTVGTLFTATLTCTNIASSTSDQANYFVLIQNPPPNLPLEVNVAIDEGLWYLHKTQSRYAPGFGRWDGGYAGGWPVAIGAANINAFEVNGHLETGNPDNPYVETVHRGLGWLFTTLAAKAVSSQTNPLGTFNPDTNGNGLGVFVAQGYSYYQGGPVMDAIIASGTPSAITSSGGAGILGRTYKDIVQDMADDYFWAQYDSSPAGGGWRYNANEWPDNSACQWAAIGLIPAERIWGIPIPAIVKNWNKVWLQYSQDPVSGVFGYTDRTPVWGPYATTPSGMVQLALDGLGRGNSQWDLAETFMRDNFANGGGPVYAVKDYYYGLFSFVKSLLLHDGNGDGIAEPIQLLHSTTPGVPDIDWYAAEESKGDPTDGVARTLVDDQDAGGFWWGHNFTGEQYPFETAFAIIMLNRTVFEPVPVAVADALPNPSLAGDTVTLDGTGSFHQNPARSIVLYEWDLDNDGLYDMTGSVITHIFPVTPPPPPPSVVFPVRLRVTDDGAPAKTATTTISVVVSTPPVAPTASANGPYVFCTGDTPMPWRLDGTGSVNPDDGIAEPGRPGDSITEYAWEVDGDNDFNDFVSTPQPDVTAFYTGLGVGDYLVQLRVTDNTAASFPSSGLPDLTSVDSAEVRVRPSGDPLCVVGALTIDIKPPSPGVAPVSLPPNTKSKGKIPVAILGTANLPVTDIDQGTLTFGRTGNESSLAVKPNGLPLCAMADVNADLTGDLVCHFYTVIADFRCGDTLGYLKGATLGGQPITGSDPIKVVGKGCKP